MYLQIQGNVCPIKKPRLSGVFCYQCRGGLHGNNVCCSRSLGTVNNFEAHALAFLQSPETLSLNGRMVDKYILSSVLLDKAESL